MEQSSNYFFSPGNKQRWQTKIATNYFGNSFNQLPKKEKSNILNFVRKKTLHQLRQFESYHQQN